MNPFNKTHFEYNHKTKRPDLVYTYRRIKLPKYLRIKIPNTILVRYEKFLLSILVLGIVLVLWLYSIPELRIVANGIAVIFLAGCIWIIGDIFFGLGGITTRRAVITEEEYTEILRVGKKIDLLSYQWKDSCLYDNLFHVVNQEEYDKITKEVMV